MPLDPIFAAPSPFFSIEDEALDSSAWLAEQIASLEEDIRFWDATAECKRKQIPQLERDVLICERDAAIAKLKIIDLKTQLAAKTGGR